MSPSVEYKSRFRSSTDACDDITAMPTVAQQAASVMNLDTNYPPPYVME